MHLHCTFIGAHLQSAALHLMATNTRGAVAIEELHADEPSQENAMKIVTYNAQQNRREHEVIYVKKWTAPQPESEAAPPVTISQLSQISITSDISGLAKPASTAQIAREKRVTKTQLNSARFITKVV